MTIIMSILFGLLLAIIVTLICVLVVSVVNFCKKSPIKEIKSIHIVKVFSDHFNRKRSLK